ncbi:unnamed protein product [Chrysodeixis includens]|uniref:Ricin B lectin domain-containing protein n=1 Tax=Chrysodeixis includens TaxID=689277 RepID=A0A9N8KUB8_CHRIL|nr:unnamed protein product [Chrysodeixis includens]
MDEYAQHLYDRRPHYRKIDTGDISEQKALREKLKCKSFRWFMTQIAFDLTAKYPTKEPNPFAKGHVRPVTNNNMCIDAHHGEAMDKLHIKPCSTTPDAEQEFIFSWHKDIRSKSRNFCWDLPESAPKSPIRLFSCHLGGGNQLWRYHMDTKQIKHGGDDHCIEWSATEREVFINRCDVTRAAQRWTVDTVDPDMMAKWTSMRTRVTGPVEDP